MQYYSKSPKQLQEEREASSAANNKKVNRGRFILLLDIALVIMIIMFYQSNLKEFFTTRENAMKNFQWKSWQVEAGCPDQGNCQITVRGDGDLSTVSTMKWVLKDRDDQLLLEETQVLERASVEGQPTLFGSYVIARAYADARLYVQLTDRTKGEEITFRIYP